MKFQNESGEEVYASRQRSRRPRLPAGTQALLAIRNEILLILHERGLSSAQISKIPGIVLEPRTIRESINQAKKLRECSEKSIAARIFQNFSLTGLAAPGYPFLWSLG